jgi:hypothetical protein
VKRLILLALCAVLAAACCGTGASSRAPKRAVPLPRVRVASHAIVFHRKDALLVRSITVAGIAGMHLHVSCGRCRRYPTKIHETYPKRGVKRFSGVNWILVAGRSIRVIVTHHGRLGRYLLLGVGAGKGGSRKLVYKASGCLSSKGKRRRCPRRGKRSPKGAVPGGSPTPTGPTGTWQLFGSVNGAPELGFIKTVNTASGTIEVHLDVLGGETYRRIGDYTSDFNIADAGNGTWQLFGSANGAPLLGFVKTTNTGSGRTEVYWDVLSDGSYKRVGGAVSDIGLLGPQAGTWQLLENGAGAPRLGLVLTADTGTGTIEPHWADFNGSDYVRAGDFGSDLSTGEAVNGTWQLFGSANGAPELGFIKTAHTGTGTIEPHWGVLNGGAYQRIGDFGSDITTAEAANGTWQYFGSANGAPELGLIKTANTGSGTVEVHWSVLGEGGYRQAAAYTSDFSLAEAGGS